MRHLLLAALLALSAPAPGLAQAHDEDHLAELDGFCATHAWTRATTGDEALVFVELENRGAAAVLVEGAEADIARTAELVGFELVEGAPAYTPLPPLPVEPGRGMVLAPDGLAIRLSGLRQGLAEGDEFELHLFTSLGELELHVAVESATARQHGHAGHSH